MAIRPIRPDDDDPQPGGGFLPNPQAAPVAPPPPPPAPAGGYDYTKFRDRWMGSGVNTVQGAQDWLKANQDVGQGVNMVGDKFDLNGDGVGDVDVIMGAKSGGGMAGPQWTNPYAASGGGAGGAGGPGGAAGAGGAGGAGSNAFQDQIRQIILAQLGQAGQPVTGDDAAIRAQFNPQSQVLQRNAARQRAAMAERLNAQGMGDSGALDAGVQGIGSELGLQEAGLMGELVGRELQSRRAQMQGLLAMAMQSGDAEAARAVQMQIAAMDAELRRYGIAEGGRQFDASLGQRRGEWNDSNDLDWARFFGGRL